MLALHGTQRIFSLRHAPSWFLLSFSAGAVNVVAFLACARFVTHVTGTVTHMGMDGSSMALAADYALVLACFVVGAMCSVLAIDARHYRGKRPLYALPLVVVTGTLVVVATLGRLGLFGEFGGEPEESGDFALLSLLAFAMGLQNAAVATSTGQTVRTTHLTGPATDLGLHLGTMLYAKGEALRAARRGAWLRGGKVLSFAVGAFAGVPLAASLGYGAFLVPAATVLFATALSFVPRTATAPEGALR